MQETYIQALKECSDFKHFISLGHCCYVAIELEKLGLRDASMPFDWVRTRWHAITRSLNTNFAGYLNYDSLYQKRNDLHAYKNLEYGVGFFHDFVSYKSLKSQINSVKKKYSRRIKRFSDYITEPTLFIRYMWDSDELIYITEHYAEVEKMVKHYNPYNEIVFISHDDVGELDVSRIKFLFLIKKEENAELCETPISACQEFWHYLKNIPYEKREKNIRFTEEKFKKELKKLSLIQKVRRKYIKHILSHKKYIHKKQC